MRIESELEMPSRTGRTEKRIHLAVNVQVWAAGAPGYEEKSTTENVSAHGARIVTSQAHLPSDRLFVASRGAARGSEGRVVYCQPLAGGRFGLGLVFSDNIAVSAPKGAERPTPFPEITENLRGLNS